ncbi:anti-sigma factor family protein [Dinghuibacter silviterrae]|uniref:Uncharacterized protein n=1 Tax=Dinghuibacter silviterrae TaxID=1539049 RepID=A0A4R8DW22_9BACT|nr:hypothetical protein [Dinghuibacter silviterrae]TDX01411.1 hypothetical protein EDB95_2446 [Dinghuibacter silviterrae]
MEERLWDFIDGRADASERAAVEALLATDGAAREKYAELLELHEALHASGLEEPGVRFTKNVMEAIAPVPYVNKRVIRGIAVLLLSLIGVVLVYILLQIPSFPKGKNLPMPVISIPDIQLNPYVSIVCVFVAVVSGFIALDALLHKKKTA